MTELRRYDHAVQKLLPVLWLRGYNFSEQSDEPLPGDLVMLQSAPDTEWHLSWYLEDQGDDRHLLESLKTGKTCTWTNVGFVIMNRNWVSKNPRIRWTDEQFAFEALFNAESRRAGFHHHVPFIEGFDEGAAIIKFRVRFARTETLTTADPFAIRDITRADLRCHLWKWWGIHRTRDIEALIAEGLDPDRIKAFSRLL